MNYIELFGGIGGFSYGIEKAWQSKPKEQRIRSIFNDGNKSNTEGRQINDNHTCLAYYELDKYAVQTYNKNFGTSWKPADIRKVSAGSVPDHDVLCAGFPCQSFSIAGKRKGFVDTRGTLFFEICRIAQAKRPKILFLENVKGLLNHDNGRTFATILLSLYELGYFVEWQVLNSKHYGVPQNRERVFIIGHLGGEPRQKVFPIGEDDKPYPNTERGTESETQFYTAITSREGARKENNFVKVAGTLDEDGWEKRHEQIRRVHDVSGISPTIPTGTGGGVMTKIITHNLQPKSEFRPSLLKDKNAGGHGHLQKDDGTTYTLDSGNTQAVEIKPVAYRTRTYMNQGGHFEFRGDNVANQLTTVQKDSMLMKEQQIRRLTPTECERLQGFPDGWTEGVSDTQRYKQLGNAVTTNVIEAIANKLLKCWN